MTEQDRGYLTGAVESAEDMARKSLEDQEGAQRLNAMLDEFGGGERPVFNGKIIDLGEFPEVTIPEETKNGFGKNKKLEPKPVDWGGNKRQMEEIHFGESGDIGPVPESDKKGSLLGGLSGVGTDESTAVRIPRN